MTERVEARGRHRRPPAHRHPEVPVVRAAAVVGTVAVFASAATPFSSHLAAASSARPDTHTGQGLLAATLPRETLPQQQAEIARLLRTRDARFAADSSLVVPVPKAAAQPVAGAGDSPAMSLLEAAITTSPDLGAAPQARAAVAAALSQLGKPYEWGATGPDAYDCSGLTQTAYRSAGVAIPRVAADQARIGTAVRLADLLPGDLLFWAYDVNDPATIHHVAMYLGNGLVVQAPDTGDVVKVSPLWLDGYAGAVRVVPATAGGAMSVGAGTGLGAGSAGGGTLLADGGSAAAKAAGPGATKTGTKAGTAARPATTKPTATTPKPTTTPTAPTGTPTTHPPGTSTPPATTSPTPPPGTSTPPATTPPATTPATEPPTTTPPASTSPTPPANTTPPVATGTGTTTTPPTATTSPPAAGGGTGTGTGGTTAGTGTTATPPAAAPTPVCAPVPYVPPAQLAAANLTAREIQLLRLLAAGGTTTSAAEATCSTPVEVQARLAMARTRLDLTTTASLIAYARAQGLVP